MKKKIHPQNNEIDITCACGNSIKTMSTDKEIHIDICSACHPFFTGQHKFIDTAGRIEKFQKKYGKKPVETTKSAAKAAPKKKAATKAVKK